MHLTGYLAHFPKGLSAPPYCADTPMHVQSNQTLLVHCIQRQRNQVLQDVVQQTKLHQGVQDFLFLSRTLDNHLQLTQVNYNHISEHPASNKWLKNSLPRTDSTDKTSILAAKEHTSQVMTATIDGLESACWSHMYLDPQAAQSSHHPADNHLCVNGKLLLTLRVEDQGCLHGICDKFVRIPSKYSVEVFI